MGLDITAYKKLTPVQDGLAVLDKNGDLADSDSFFRISDLDITCTEKDWPGRTSGLEPGVFEFEERLDFWAGSYSGYNEFRNWLATVGGWESDEACWHGPATEGPFYELINFADNEGVIGPNTAKKLEKDFADFREEATKKATADWHMSDYDQWHNAFALAAKGGAIDFH